MKKIIALLSTICISLTCTTISATDSIADNNGIASDNVGEYQDGGITYEYDENGRKIKEIHNEDGSIYTYEYEYDADGRKIKEIATYDTGVVITRHFDRVGNVLQSIYTEGDYTYATTYEYADDGSVSKRIEEGSDGEVYTLTYEYYENGNVHIEYKKNVDGIITITEYDEDGNILDQRTEGEISDSGISYEYYENGNISKLTRRDADGNVYYTAIYDADERILKEVNDDGSDVYTTIHTYHEGGSRTRTVTNADGTYTNITDYDENGDVTRVYTDDHGVITEKSYTEDKKEEKKTETLTIYNYCNEYWDIVKQISSYGNGEIDTVGYEFEYDENGNAVKEIQNGGETVIIFEYGSDGNLIKEVTSSGDGTSSVTNEYDENGNRVKRITETIDGKITTDEFEYSGDLITKVTEITGDIVSVYKYEFEGDYTTEEIRYDGTIGSDGEFLFTDEVSVISMDYEFGENGNPIKQMVDYSRFYSSPSFVSEYENLLTAEAEIDSDGYLSKTIEEFKDSTMPIHVTVYHNILIDNLTEGDLDADGEIGVVDLVMMGKFVMGEGILSEFSMADLSGDEIVNSVDLAILRHNLVS
jgi:antitoxin component YwqK of YwqJK toxin-antitoxin module